MLSCGSETPSRCVAHRFVHVHFGEEGEAGQTLDFVYRFEVRFVERARGGVANPKSDAFQFVACGLIHGFVGVAFARAQQDFIIVCRYGIFAGVSACILPMRARYDIDGIVAHIAAHFVFEVEPNAAVEVVGLRCHVRHVECLFVQFACCGAVGRWYLVPARVAIVTAFAHSLIGRDNQRVVWPYLRTLVRPVGAAAVAGVQWIGYPTCSIFRLVKTDGVVAHFPIAECGFVCNVDVIVVVDFFGHFGQRRKRAVVHVGPWVKFLAAAHGDGYDKENQTKGAFFHDIWFVFSRY